MKQLDIKDMAQTESNFHTSETPQMSQLKQSELFSQRKMTNEKNQDRFNRWLDENDQKEDRVRSFEDVKGMQKNWNTNKEPTDENAFDKSELDDNYKSMEGLMMEKSQLKQEQEKIKNNKFLRMVDRTNAIKSVRSLSRTIDELIEKEKMKISDHYASKLEKSRISNLTNSKMMSSKGAQQDETNDLKNSLMKS